MVEYDTERRITLRLLAYWEKLRGGRVMPDESDIQADDIADLWGDCFLIQLKNIGADAHVFSYAGPKIKEIYQCVPHERGDKVMAPYMGPMMQAYRQVIATGKPLVDEGEFQNIHKQDVRFRQCLLPLGTEEGVTAILGGLRFKVFLS